MIGKIKKVNFLFFFILFNFIYLDFERINGKYMLLKFKDSKIEYKKMIAPFDFKILPKTKIVDIPVFELIKEFTQSALYFKILNNNNCHIEKNEFNIEFLDRDLLNKANDILNEIVNLKNKRRSLSSKFPPDENTIEEANKIYSQAEEFSNKYYELIPRNRFNYSVNC